MLKIAVLGSTRGTDLQALIDTQIKGQFPKAQIALIVSNRADAYILERAKQAGIEAICIESKGKTRTDFEQALQALLERRQIGFILCIGFMKIFSADFVKLWPKKILNIHPSLLPKYSGGMDLNVHEEVLKNKETVTGCTLHYVSDAVDGGEIYLQQEVSVLPNDTPDTLKERVQAAEQAVLVKAVQQISA
ncbi:MAG: phosphoribosylglycinamide formyltransferase [uncultured bacterium]|nr:MAG: phosphoribosylglycinamide formyltransferase [uncultured bacterium]